MRPHLRYLRYVLLHKWYVFRAGTFIGAPAGVSIPRWLWRLVTHDLSKFRPSEWRPYVRKFYGPMTADVSGVSFRVNNDREFDRAWLEHIHRNPHHWQHWVLHEDSGKTKVLLMPITYVDEMVADWIGAGTKILHRPTLDECIAETIKWYAVNNARMMLREPVRQRVEATLIDLANRIGIYAWGADEIAATRAQRSHLTVNLT